MLEVRRKNLTHFLLADADYHFHADGTKATDTFATHVGVRVKDPHDDPAHPAPISESTQGGVRPRCGQGSRVTYTVDPRAALPAPASATISA